MQSAAVDFIAVLPAHFSYEFFAKAKIYLEKAAKTTFVRKICTYEKFVRTNVDEIDTRRETVHLNYLSTKELSTLLS